MFVAIHDAPIIRLIFFFGILVLMAIWEKMSPRRTLLVNKRWRWFSNLGLAVVNTVALRVVFALGALGVAEMAKERDGGIFNVVALPVWLSFLLSAMALDCVFYLQQVFFIQFRS